MTFLDDDDPYAQAVQHCLLAKDNPNYNCPNEEEEEPNNEEEEEPNTGLYSVNQNKTKLTLLYLV